MLSSFFPRAYVRYVSTPVVGQVLDEFCAWLHARGYPFDAIRRRMQGSCFVGKALRRRGRLSLQGLTAEDLWAIAPTPTSWTAQVVRTSLRSLTRYLEEERALSSRPKTATEGQVASYSRYLETVRGLARSTVAKHARQVSEFLRFLDYDRNPGRLRTLRGADVEAFVRHTGQRLGRASMQIVVSVLRSLLRFLASEGAMPAVAGVQIDSPRCSRNEMLPRALPWRSVRSLLLSVDRTTAKGRRDYTILLMAATYGLRAGEIATLKLDDVDWRSRVLRVPRSKVADRLSLPLTDEVATALIEYVRHNRQRSNHRELFLRVRIPIGPIAATAVKDIFAVWAAHAGIRLPRGRGGLHCLRHSVALHLLRRGVSMKTIGDLLGHRSVESTCMYLRLQVDDLRDVALQVPEEVES